MTVDEFKAQYPDVANGMTDAQIQMYLDLFKCQYTLDYGCMTEYLQGLFVAHRGTISKKKDGPIIINITKRVGDVSVSGKTAGGSDESGYGVEGDFSATRYGVEFWQSILPFGAGAMMAQPYYG